MELIESFLFNVPLPALVICVVWALVRLVQRRPIGDLKWPIGIFGALYLVAILLAVDNVT